MSSSDPSDIVYDRRVAMKFCRFAGGWWSGATARQAWFFSIALAALIIGNIGLNVAVNAWNRMFFDALEKREAGTLGTAVLIFAGLVVVVAGIGVLIVVTRETLQVRWREWLVGRLIGTWLDRKRYYRLGLARNEPANPEYRIADDSRMATEPVVDFAIGLLNALLTALAFVGILWTVGGSLTVAVGGTQVTIPAYMMLAALIYGVAASWLMLRVGRPLVPGVAAKNEAEAKLRFELTRLRENAESIALIRGERDERAILDRTYGNLVTRWLNVVRLHGRLTWITNASGALIPVVPLLLATPKYLSGELSLGAVTQLAAAFFQVQIAFAWLVDNYKPVAQWYASARRVTAIVEAVEELEDSFAHGGIAVAEGERLELEGLTVTDRAGRVLIADAHLAINPGEKVLIMGESGIGKSTLVRAVAGLWPWGRGLVSMPAGAELAFVPQRPYLPLGALRQVLLYPAVDLPIQDEAVVAVLGECGLGHLASRLDEVERWDQILSSGERQRLALARLILQKPAVVIMDEATSALDEASQARLMTMLTRELPDTTLISIGHRPGLEAHHDRVLRLVRTEAGARLIGEAAPEPLRATA
ncbi:MAG TPA: ABC transporter ATP-binding protein/permease [Beijerinckiaceae bacterium]|nr:ABC transporter ATP-binding protein/permease [Beijerinckiaceae bacterium]